MILPNLLQYLWDPLRDLLKFVQWGEVFLCPQVKPKSPIDPIAYWLTFPSEMVHAATLIAKDSLSSKSEGPTLYMHQQFILHSKMRFLFLYPLAEVCGWLSLIFKEGNTVWLPFSFFTSLISRPNYSKGGRWSRGVRTLPIWIVPSLLKLLSL